MRVQQFGRPVAAAVFVSALFTGTQAVVGQTPEFRWHGMIAQGSAIEVKGVNGNVRAEASGSNEVEVVAEKRARRSNPEDVRIEVVQHADGVTICAVYPSRDASRPNVCAPGHEGRMNVQDNDVTVNFTVRVPAGVRLIGTTVNGEVEALRLNGPIALSTVNGSVTFSTSASGKATTVNGTIRGELGRADWTDTLEFSTVNGSINLTLPPDLSTDVKAQTVNGDISTDFPLTVTGRISRRRLEGTIGSGGRTLSLETVNGGISLKRS
ncbi:MAG TPA: DUF4097 family beta strand repeat-containing protein [Vicinamibacterales bacterium]